GAGGLITLQKKLPVMITMLALTGALLTVGSFGALLSFAVLSLPFMILSFSSVSEYLSRTLTTTLKANENILQVVMTGLAILLVVITTGSILSNSAYVNIGSASHFGLGIEEEAFPVAAAEILGRDDFPEKILNISHDGGYIAVSNPKLKIFCDTRTPFYGEDFYDNLDKALRGDRSAWSSIQSEWNPEAVVINGAWPDAGALANRLISIRNEKLNQIWKLVYFDGATIILVKNQPEYASLIKDPTIQQSGLQILEESRKAYIAQNKGLVQSGNSSRLIGASAFYLALRRPIEAEALYRTLTENSPNMSLAWLGLGQSLIYQKKLTQGIEYMEKAASITPRSAQVWLGLYHAYNLQENKEKATEAAEQLNKFFQAEKATVEQKKIAEKKKTEESAPVIDHGMDIPEELK
ncbi:MAG: hypothetical protein OEL75_03630, partial [Kiritimatiellaceae bacterium]|nr:hypothetical protein [Kiritimatiellaceae bacterium]